jgi:hypothetical protein
MGLINWLTGYDWYERVWCRHTWEYVNNPNGLYAEHLNVRFCRACKSLQLFDVDGWSGLMSPDEAYRKYGVPRAQQLAANNKMRRLVGFPETDIPFAYNRLPPCHVCHGPLVEEAPDHGTCAGCGRLPQWCTCLREKTVPCQG